MADHGTLQALGNTLVRLTVDIAVEATTIRKILERLDDTALDRTGVDRASVQRAIGAVKEIERIVSFTPRATDADTAEVAQ